MDRQVIAKLPDLRLYSVHPSVITDDVITFYNRNGQQIVEIPPGTSPDGRVFAYPHSKTFANGMTVVLQDSGDTVTVIFGLAT